MQLSDTEKQIIEKLPTKDVLPLRLGGALVVLGIPSEGDWDRYVDHTHKGLVAQSQREVVLCSVLYPSREELQEMLRKRPRYVQQLAEQLGTFAGGEIDDLGKA